MTRSGEPGSRPDAARDVPRGSLPPSRAGRPASEDGATADRARADPVPRPGEACDSPAIPAELGEQDPDGQDTPASRSEDDRAALASLRRDWGKGYEVSHIGGQWTARRITGNSVIAADSASELHELISQDYSRRRASARAGGQPDGAGTTGAGEQALRRLIEDGVI